MRGDPQLDRLEALVDQQVEALAQRVADDGAVSFAGGEQLDPELDVLWGMVQRARGGDEPVSFGAAVGQGGGALDDGTLDGAELDQAQREGSSWLEALLQAVSYPTEITTGAGRSGLRTRVGWVGDIITHVDPGASPRDVAAHRAAVEASLVQSASRLRRLSIVVSAAGKISALIATPTGAVTALIIAYRCVRGIQERLA